MNIPIASLPKGRGGNPGYSVSLQYDSKLLESVQTLRNDGSPDENGNTKYQVSTLGLSDRGGWRLATYYKLVITDRLYNYAPDVCWLGDPVEHLKFRWKFEMEMPDGSVRQFFPLITYGSNPIGSSDGYSAVDRNGTYYQIQQGSNPCTITDTYPQITTSGVTFITLDGSRLRLFIPYQSDNWKLYSPGGSVVENAPPSDSTIGQRTTDRNGNYVDYKTDGRIVDQLGRSIEFSTNSNYDTIVSVKGVGGETVSTRIEWGERWIHAIYGKTAAQNANPFEVSGTLLTSTLTVDKIVFPEQLQGTQEMVFDYWGDVEQPDAEDYTDGWGELKQIELPTGATSDFEYSAGAYMAQEVLERFATSKTLGYSDYYDGGSTSRSDEWSFTVSKYGGSVTNPDGSVSSEGKFYNLYTAYWESGLAFVSVNPDKTKVERLWGANLPMTISASGPYNYAAFAGSGTANAYVRAEMTTLPYADGTIDSNSPTAIKEYRYDKNGNVIEIKEYDWVPHGSVPRSGNAHVTGLPTSGLTLLRKTVNTYYNQAASADSATSNPNAYHDPSSPKLKNVIKSTETQDGSGDPKSRSEFFYDDPDDTGNLIETRSWDNTKGALASPDSNGFRLNSGNSIFTLAEYDEYGNAIETTDPNGNVTQITYGNIAGPNGNVTGLYPTQTVAAYGTSVARTSSATYDFYTGLLTSTTDEDNDVTNTTEYDDLGRSTKVSTADGATGFESWTVTEYHDADRYVVVKSDLETVGDGKKVATQFYDQLGRVRLSKTLEDAATEDPGEEEDGIKVQTRYEFATGYTYQLTSNPYRADHSDEETDPSMGWTRSKAWSNGRKQEIETFSGASLPGPWGSNNSSTGVVTTNIDANRTLVTDQAGKQRVSRTNALGQLKDIWEIIAQDSATVAVTFPSTSIGYGYLTSYSYDTLNNLILVDQGDQEREFTYSSLSRLLSAENPESGTIAYEYDNNSNLIEKTDARGILTTYSYDQLNRVTDRMYVDEPSGSETPDVEYTYGTTAPAIGKLIKVESSVSTTEYTAFDILGRVTASKQTTDGTDYISGYEYNLSGALVEQTYPSGRVVKNVIDNNGDLSLVQSKKNSASGYWNYAGSFTYNAAGAVTSMQLGNGRWESTTFNSRLQPTQIALSTTPGATNLLDLDYSYGTTSNNGNVVSQTITVPGLAHPFVQTYTYDSLNRLGSATETNNSTQTWKQAFVFDRYGNRRFDFTSGNTTTPESTCTEATCNPTISTSTNRINSSGYSFDSSGNTTAAAEGRTFIYDAENKQVKVLDSEDETIGEYFYDGDGRRVKKYVPSTGETTVFVYDAASKLVAEYSTIVASSNDAKVAYLTNDHLGSPRINTDVNGQVIARHDYHPFGEEIATSQRTAGLAYIDDTVRKQFTGYERDDETALDYAVNRYHSPNLGRFTQVDPYNIIFEKEKGEDAKEVARILNKYLADPQNWNRYAYVVNNPLKYSDPDGLRPQTDQEKKDLDYLRNLANSSTDADFKRAVLDSVKGIEDAIAASKDQASDPRGLRIALWAVNRAAQPDTTRFAMATGEASLTWQGYTATAGKGQWKCNIFVAAAYTLGGGVNFDENGIPVTYRYKGLGAATGSVNLPTANDFASGNDDKLKGFERMANVRMGDIAAWANPGGLGHTAISIGGDAVIYAGPSNVKVNTLNATRQGLGANTPAAVFRRKRE